MFSTVTLVFQPDYKREEDKDYQFSIIFARA